MTVTLASMFRDSAEYVPRYFAQIEALREKEPVRLVLAEGDSTDGTYEAILPYLEKGDVLLKADHGGPKFGSVNHPRRWQQIAIVAREIVEHLEPDDAVVWVESDLLWKPDAIIQLLDDLTMVEAVAPMVFANDNGTETSRYYDTFSYKIDGVGFLPQHPYYVPTIQVNHLCKIDSCGSCFATTAFHELREWDGFWPCKLDGLLWLDPGVEVRHP